MTVALSSERGPATAPTAFDARWRQHAGALAGVVAALLLLFHRDVADLAAIWWHSTTFGHCMFVPPIVAWLLWQRRVELAQVPPVAWWPGVAVVAAGGAAWLVGEAAAVALFRHLGLVAMVQGAAVAILGPHVARAIAFPIAYLTFAVPFGESLQAPLQDATVALVMPLLHVLGVPASVDGVLITTPTGWFEVAEACSGLKFVIAMLAYGALVANVCYRSWRRRAAFLAMALAVPIAANGIRAAGTIYAAHLTSVEAATGFDHIVYGWVFFAVVMAAVLAIGWRWFDRDPDARWFDPAAFAAPARRTTDAATGAGLVLAIAVGFAGWGWIVDGRAQPVPRMVAMPVVAGWTQIDAPTATPWSPYYPGADGLAQARYVDGAGRVVDLAIAVYGSQHEGKELVGFGQGAIRENDRWVRVADLPDIAGGQAMRMTAPGPIERLVVTWYRVGDTTTGGARAAKLATLRAKLLGGPQRAVAVLASAEGNPAQAADAVGAFARAMGPVAGVADRAAGMR